MGTCPRARARWCGFSAGVLVASVLVVACGGGDREACEADDDCHGGYCEPSGFCAGKADCQSDSDCEFGWRCVGYDSAGDDVANYFGLRSGSSVCIALCGHCPPTQHCMNDSNMLCVENGS